MTLLLLLALYQPDADWRRHQSDETWGPTLNKTIENLLWHSSEDVGWYCKYHECDLA